MHFSDALDAFLSDPRIRGRLKPSTLHAYRTDLLAAALALPVQLAAIGPTDLRGYLDQEIAPSTAARRLAALRALFAWAIREDYCTNNSTAMLETPRSNRRLPRPIRADADRQAVDRAIVAVPQTFRLALTILRATGMRAGEVLALTIGDVALDAVREALHVRDAKNRRERMIVLGSAATPKSLRELRALLRERKREPPHAPRFRSNRGTRLSYDALHDQWAQGCAAVGLADAVGKPHDTLLTKWYDNTGFS